VVDRRCHENAQADFGDSPRGNVKGVARVERARNADDCHGVTGQDKAVGGKVSRVLRAEGAEADPPSERPEEEDALLGEKRDEEKRHAGADHSPDNAI
jgi:hypothetical protein